MRPCFRSACSKGASRNRAGLVSTRLPLFPGQASRGRIAPGQVHEREPFLAQPTFVSTHCIVCMYMHARAHTKNTHCVLELHITPQKTKPPASAHLQGWVKPPLMDSCGGGGPAQPEGPPGEVTWTSDHHPPPLWNAGHQQHQTLAGAAAAPGSGEEKQPFPPGASPCPPLPRQRKRNLPDHCQA